VRRTAILIPLGALALAGCGSSGGSDTPAACLAPASAYVRALTAAPGEVRLDGDTAISSCLTEGQSGGQLATVGDSMVTAATKLNAAALRDPAGQATVSLGYLDGAVHEGASTTGGIHADLVRRVDAAARFNPGGGSPGAEFERGFGKGYAAGQQTG
jgi:hypothetical protein